MLNLVQSNTITDFTSGNKVKFNCKSAPIRPKLIHKSQHMAENKFEIEQLNLQDWRKYILIGETEYSEFYRHKFGNDESKIRNRCSTADRQLIGMELENSRSLEARFTVCLNPDWWVVRVVTRLAISADCSNFHPIHIVQSYAPFPDMFPLPKRSHEH